MKAGHHRRKRKTREATKFLIAVLGRQQAVVQFTGGAAGGGGGGFVVAAANFDVVVAVGGRHSSNSNKSDSVTHRCGTNTTIVTVCASHASREDCTGANSKMSLDAGGQTVRHFESCAHNFANDSKIAIIRSVHGDTTT